MNLFIYLENENGGLLHYSIKNFVRCKTAM